jgi:hypothetical protein
LFLKIFSLFIILLSISSGPDGLIESSSQQSGVSLEFSMRIDRDIYKMTDFGEPPQIAVWLQDPGGGKIKTVWVTRRSGRRIWKGKFECPTALPLWDSLHRSERSGYKERGVFKRLIDAFSGATPRAGVFKVRVTVPRGMRIECFVEVNLSGDFNQRFPYRDKNGMPDPEVNGQPSLIYRGSMIAEPGREVLLKLIGRTAQWTAVDFIIKDLSGITSAAGAVTGLKAVCKRE